MKEKRKDNKQMTKNQQKMNMIKKGNMITYRKKNSAKIKVDKKFKTSN